MTNLEEPFVSSQREIIDTKIRRRIRLSRLMHRTAVALAVTTGIAVGLEPAKASTEEALTPLALPVAAVGAAVLDRKKRRQKCLQLIADFGAERSIPVDNALLNPETIHPEYHMSALRNVGQVCRPGNYLATAMLLDVTITAAQLHDGPNVLVWGAFAGLSIQSGRYFDRDLTAEHQAYTKQLDAIDYF